MCGIVGATAERQVSPILMEGLRRLEYRGYDSSGIAAVNPKSKKLHVLRNAGKVADLDQLLQRRPLRGVCGIGHTRWATHGKPSRKNAHPHLAGSVALVHNGIIENYQKLRDSLNVRYKSNTDTEVVAHMLNQRVQQGDTLLEAMQAVLPQLEGSYSLLAVCEREPEKLVMARQGSPLVLGLGLGENFVASDVLALHHVTDRFVYLEENDIAVMTPTDYVVYNREGQLANREVHARLEAAEISERGQYRNFMEKEIYEQPGSVAATLEQVWDGQTISHQAFGVGANRVLRNIKNINIIACGTSFHAALIAKYWIEQISGIPCSAEIASEFRYRNIAARKDSLLIAISQSGETADTLAAVAAHREQYKKVLSISNMPNSTLVRETDLVFLTRAGQEISVASTKAFTTQLVSLLTLALLLGRDHGYPEDQVIQTLNHLSEVPQLMRQVLEQSRPEVQHIAQEIANCTGALFLGRGTMYPLAREGALKLKELSYMHAEAYPAGELKHGPLALVDENMPVVVVAPKNPLLSKLESNLAEVRARGGRLFLVCDEKVAGAREHSVHMPDVDPLIAPLIYALPLQLLAYEVAILRGTDVDQPRNIAKSVTVE